MLYQVRVKTTGFSNHEAEYFLKFEGQAVRTVPARHEATEFHLQEAVDTLEKLKQLGVVAEICESVWGQTIGQPFERTPVERAIPADMQWLTSLFGESTDGRVFLKANGQTIYASSPAELVQKLDALANSFTEWGNWLAQNKPIPQPAAPPAPPPEPISGYWVVSASRSARFADREQALGIAYRLQQRGENAIVVDERGVEQC